MKPEEKHTAYIREAWSSMLTKEDLLALLNYAKPLAYESKTVPFELKQLTWYSNPKINSKRYSTFSIKKKSGNERIIHAPVEGLKAIQKTLAYILQCVHEPHKAALGFVRERSIVDNARLHEGQRYIYNIDLKDFFPSVDQARVWKCLQLSPLNLNNRHRIERQWFELIQPGIGSVVTSKGEMLYYKINADRNKAKLLKYKGDYKAWIERVEQISKEHAVPPQRIVADSLTFLVKEKYTKLLTQADRSKLANIIAAICCTELEVERKNEQQEWLKVKCNVLPQGAPTSPVLTNIVCQKLDFLLSAVARRFGLKYSRYADDITFSSMHNVYQDNSEFLSELHRIVKQQGFHIQDSKTRLQKEGFRQEVTGLLVNEKVNVRKGYIKQLRMWLYYWERYGYERSEAFFLKQYFAEKGHMRRRNPGMVNVIFGKLEYLKMVKGEESELFKRLSKRYDILTSKNIQKQEQEVNSETDFDTTEGIKEGNTNDIANFHSNGEDKDNHEQVIHQIAKGEQEKLNIDEKRSLDIFRSHTKVDKHAMTASDQQLFSGKSNKGTLLTIPIIHEPRKLVNLLKNFSINDSPLKYTTHSWDAGRDAGIFKHIADFLDLARKQYSGFSFQLKTLSNNLNGKIYNFLLNPDVNEKGWGVHRIKFGWSSPVLVESCTKNDTLKPEDFILPETFQIFNRVTKSYETIQKFKQVVDIFKNEIEIRDENSVLLNLILEKHDKYLSSFSDPVINNLDNKTFYTDVQWLSKALDLIFENIQKRPQHREVFYSVINDKDDSLTLEIMQNNSNNRGKSFFDEKLTLSKGDFSEIAKYLKNLCDWSIESDFLEGSYKINYLTSELDTPPVEKIEKPNGFKYSLTFYK